MSRDNNTSTAAAEIHNQFAIFKNALVYTITFRVVSTLTEHSAGSTVVLVAISFMATNLVRRALTSISKQTTDKTATPIQGSILDLSKFVLATAASAGIHMQSNLIGAYVSGMYSDGLDPIYIVISSAMGVTLLWILGTSVGVEL